MGAVEQAIQKMIDDALAPLRLEIADLRARVGAAPRRMVSRAEAAEHLGVSERTLDRYIRQGLVRMTKVRRKVMVDPSSLPNARDLAARARHGLPVSP